MICLDTNVVIAFLKGDPPRLVARFESEILNDHVALPVVALFELHCGVARSARRQENADRLAVFLQLPLTILPFEAQDAEEAGEIRAELERAGTPIGPYELLIAAQARQRAALLVTANTEEFARVPRLTIEDWAI
jgi:tRNA(fMet)-specific endonuclease VapC